ncbi:MAG: response regulator transcription factor [Trinickia sp.]|uniref:response regulator transcription factor n=1 Tax=Trinickia sp. TaxID=2571163 RepID=UPI002F42E3C9
MTVVCTPREREILRLLAVGLSDKQAARALSISDMTARKHRANLLRKTGAPNVCALIFMAAAAGWLDDLLQPPESA